jgi:nitrogen regulatory protein PII-like uncharacterized protein
LAQILNFPKRLILTSHIAGFFAYGYQRGLSGKEWQKYPPGYKQGFDADLPKK